MRKVYLHGSLGKRYGRVFEFEIETVNEAIDALRANFADFFNAIRHGHFKVIVGKAASNGLQLAQDQLPGFKLGKQNLHIVPVAKGSKRGGLGKIIAGIALVGLSMVSGGAAGMAASGLFGTGVNVSAVTGSIGAGLLINGVASLIAPEIDGGENTPSFTMSGPKNTTREGGIVPIVYGEVWTGGVMINGGIDIHDGNEDAPKGLFYGSSDQVVTGGA